MPFLYHANEVLKRRRLFKRRRDFQFAIVGSLATDLEWVAGMKGAHKRSLEFYHYLLTRGKSERKAKKYAPFALGMYIHKITDDWIEPTYVDTKKNFKIASNIIKKYDPHHIEIKDAQHALIEQAIDYNISNGNKKLMRNLNNALRRVFKKKNLDNITQYMEDFFGTDKEIIKSKLALFNPDSKRSLAKIEDYSNVLGQVNLWMGNMFYMINQKTIKGMYKITLIFRYLKYSFMQDKNKLGNMVLEAKDKFNDFHHIIKGFQKRLDKEVKNKLRRFYE